MGFTCKEIIIYFQWVAQDNGKPFVSRQPWKQHNCRLKRGFHIHVLDLLNYECVCQMRPVTNEYQMELLSTNRRCLLAVIEQVSLMLCTSVLQAFTVTLAFRRSMTSSIINLIRTGKSLRPKSCWIRSKYWSIKGCNKKMKKLKYDSINEPHTTTKENILLGTSQSSKAKQKAARLHTAGT